ncbi:unnamed protein product, partial [Mesorhabditis belari]|uniref:Uncharacterized protein n=1 Tax=Mesorhabditis belari TaxID=2138241 RepID=A0AAF3FUE6_9BILA
MKMNFQEIDQLLSDKRNSHQVYEKLKMQIVSEGEIDVELLWRFIQSCHQKALFSGTFNEKKNILIEGRNHAQQAVHTHPNHPNLLKFAAMVTGKSVEFVGLTDKVRQGKLFKEYLDSASELLPDDTRLLHLRARYKFSMSQMNWIERKAINAVFMVAPDHTIDEALEDLLEVYRKEPTWLDNLLYIAKSYHVKKDKVKALEFVEKCLHETAIDDEDFHHQKEAKELMGKCK